jgi:hypothetical protein
MASSVELHDRNELEFDVAGPVDLPECALEALASLLLDVIDAERLVRDRREEDGHA